MTDAAIASPPTVAGCPFCEGTGGRLVWADPTCRVIVPDEADYPGFVRVVLTEHVGEMTDLPPARRQRLMRIVWCVERVVRDRMHPDKVNLASLGNVVPHLHWHVVPRYRDDPAFPGSVWSAVQRGPAPTLVARRAAAGALPAALALALDRLDDEEAPDGDGPASDPSADAAANAAASFPSPAGTPGRPR